MVTGPDGVDYGHAADCARTLTDHGISNAHDRIRDWIRRGLLTPRTAVDGRPVYAMTDVRRVELATRKNGKRGRIRACA